MNYTEFLNYKEQHCRFKLKSGKEVYGVIWEKQSNGMVEYFFASSSVHQTYKKAESVNYNAGDEMAYRVSLEDVIIAEPLRN